MVLVLKMLYNRFAHLNLCTVQLFMETWSLCEKAPEKIDTHIEQYGNFVKHGGATSQHCHCFLKLLSVPSSQISLHLKDKKTLHNDMEFIIHEI